MPVNPIIKHAFTSFLLSPIKSNENMLLMKLFLQKWLPRAAYLFLFIYAIKFHVSSSEFWPMTISKTWLDFPHFETSLLQKLLFGLFLAVFHTIPLNDVNHVWFVKSIFALIGLGTLKYFIEYLKNEFKLSAWLHCSIYLLFLSPTLLSNFFRIRSDQFGLFFFVFALHFATIKKEKASFGALFLLLLTSAKSALFFVGGFCLLYPKAAIHFRKLTYVNRIYVATGTLATFIWLSALNLHALHYYLDSWEATRSYLIIFYNYFYIEWPLLLFSFFVSLNFLFYHKQFRASAFSAFSFFVLLFLMPQALPFFMASLIPFLYTPLLLFFGSSAIASKEKKALLAALVILQTLNLTYQHQNKRFLFYSENTQQIDFINSTSLFMQRHPMFYLDGMGSLPRQNFIPCFVSPEDEEANAFCQQELKTKHPEMVIITQRLLGLGQIVFDSVQLDYVQIRPNVWVHKNKMKDIKADEINVLRGQIPMFIFNYE